MSSPFASRLGTNYCPKDEEVLEIEQLLVEPLSRLDRLDNKITDLHQALAELIEERENLNAYVEGHRALISPVRRLPLDIIQEIFVACLPTHRNCVMSAQEAPVLLGRICSSWRAISLSTPRLWARLHIAEPTRYEVFSGATSTEVYEQKLAQRLETTKIWLSRSGQCPLSISLDSSQEHTGPPGGPDAFPNTYLFLQAMIPVASRWQNISLSVSWTVLNTLSNLTESDVPMLTKLDIGQRPEPVLPNIQWTSFALFRAPSITSFALAGAHTSPLEFPVRWGNLTTLSIMGHGWGVLTCRFALEILAKCPLLRVCRLLVNEDNTDVPADIPGFVLELPLLHSLHITSIGLPLGGIGHMLKCLSLPALQHFDLRGRSSAMSENPSFVPNLLAFLGTARCFESLRIDTQIFTKQSLIGLLRGLPTTTKQLRIADRLHSWVTVGMMGILDDDTLAVLTPSFPFAESVGVSCPHLQELHITHCSSPSDAALRRFILARMAIKPHTLRRVEVQFAREKEVDVMADPDVQRYVDGEGNGGEGLRVVTKYQLAAVAGNFSPWQGLPDAPGVWSGMDSDF
ncbi:hypothetical protein B0H19DRAFT_1096301 [Mycena capillaripes]|nr:hypothetical protein B0H19DRAFT_1096301 [Mycena capillaripes]